MIVTFGSSKPCGVNHSRASIHAEQLALRYCLKYDKRKRYEIYISRYDRKGFHKAKPCCNACCKLITKHGYHKRIFTVTGANEIISAIPEVPETSLAYKIKHGRGVV